MINTYSPTIRRKEMEAVLTCMVDEKIGPGEMNTRLVQAIKEKMSCDGAVPLRSPAIAMEYAFKAMGLVPGDGIMISALAPAYQILVLERLGYKPVVLDVIEETGLVTVEIIQKGIEEGGKALVLNENLGVLPDTKSIMELGIPVLEDISQSAFACYEPDAQTAPAKPAAEGQTPEEPRGPAAGMLGTYAMLGMEDTDVITSGGGAVLIAPKRKEWISLKAFTDKAPSVDILPDMNAALAWVEVKEYNRNEKSRKDLWSLYSRAIMSGSHKTFTRGDGNQTTVYSFPLVLNSGFKEAQSYASKKGIEVRHAFENSIIAMRQEELAPSCICANSLLLRCALFPLYPRLGKSDVEKIVRVLSTLP